MKQFISTNDISNVNEWVEKALSIKKNPFEFSHLGKNKTLGLVFLNPSLRTRLSSQKAAQNLGMNVMVMNLNQDGWALELEDGAVMNGNTQEHIKEAAGVLSQYCDIIGLRTFASLTDKEKDYQETVLKKFIQSASVPVISLESAAGHPLQAFADCITIAEHKKIKTPKVVLSWTPHVRALPQAVANSFVEWVSQTDAELVVTNPKGFDLDAGILKNTPIIHDQKEAFENADFVYAKNWSSFENYGKIGTEYQDWMIDSKKMQLTNGAKFMHCLPVRRNVVVSDEVLDSANSLVLAQAQNRIYSAQTVLYHILNN